MALIKKWSKDFDRCIYCQTLKCQHFAKGACNPCYQQHYKSPSSILRTQLYNDRKNFHSSSDYKTVIKIKAQKRVAERREKLLRYLDSHPCIDCGENDPVVLQFDHVRGVKAFEISYGLSSRSWSENIKEISKCDVRCANCHVRRTAKSFKWWRSSPSFKIDMPHSTIG